MSLEGWSRLLLISLVLFEDHQSSSVNWKECTLQWTFSELVQPVCIKQVRTGSVHGGSITHSWHPFMSKLVVSAFAVKKESESLTTGPEECNDWQRQARTCVCVCVCVCVQGWWRVCCFTPLPFVKCLGASCGWGEVWRDRKVSHSVWLSWH